MPETRTAPLADVRAALTPDGATGRHPRARPLTARYWTELVLSAAVYALVFLADVAAFGALDWNWQADPILAAWYVGLVMAGMAMQLVLVAATVQRVVHAAILTGRWVGRAGHWAVAALTGHR